MRVRIGSVGPETLGRAAQLLAKTNQFNLTTRRHSAAAIEDALRSGAIAFWAKVSDAIGDSGLTAVVIARPESDERWIIDSFVMSCRIIGRRIETAVLAHLVEELRARGARTVIGEYVPTERNAQVSELYPLHGFVPSAERPNTWTFELSERRIESPDYISLEVE